jgi:hypothetical protein
MSHQRFRPWAIALVLVILLSSIAACGGGNPLLGKWEDEEGLVIEFKDDNTFTLGAMDMVILEGTYKVSGDQLTLSTPEEEDIVAKFAVSGDKMTLTDPDSGEVLEFTRVK